MPFIIEPGDACSCCCVTRRAEKVKQQKLQEIGKGNLDGAVPDEDSATNDGEEQVNEPSRSQPCSDGQAEIIPAIHERDPWAVQQGSRGSDRSLSTDDSISVQHDENFSPFLGGDPPKSEYAGFGSSSLLQSIRDLLPWLPVADFDGDRVRVLAHTPKSNQRSPSGSPRSNQRHLSESVNGSGTVERSNVAGPNGSTAPNARNSKRNIRSGDEPPDSGPHSARRNSRKHDIPQYTCVFYGSNRSDLTEDCKTRKKYVSQLRRHHERHDFFYCVNCFLKFPSLEQRDTHMGSGLCVFICVTESCQNYGTSPAFQQLASCNHGRANSQMDQWRHLFRLARPGDERPGPRGEEHPRPETRALALQPSVVQQPLPDFSTVQRPRVSSHQISSNGRFLPTLQPAEPKASRNDNLSVEIPDFTHYPSLQSTSSSSRLANIAAELCMLAEQLEPTESAMDSNTRQTIDFITQYTQLSLQQLRQVSSALPSPSPMDMTLSETSPFIRVSDHDMPPLDNGSTLARTGSRLRHRQHLDIPRAERPHSGSLSSVTDPGLSVLEMERSPVTGDGDGSIFGWDEVGVREDKMINF